MPRTNLSADDHKRVVRECGGVVSNITEAVLNNDRGKDTTGNVGVALRIAAIRAYYLERA